MAALSVITDAVRGRPWPPIPEATLLSTARPALLATRAAESLDGDVRPVGFSLADSWRQLDAERWLLAGTADEVAPLLDEVMSGRAPVFGLAGVVLLDDAAAGATSREDGVPTLRVPVADATAAVSRFWADDVSRGPRVPRDHSALLASDRTTDRVRGIHARRALADDPAYAPQVLDVAGLAVLRALADVLVPQDGPDEERIDLAARVDARLAAGEGDGWRFDDLPPDAEAYRAGLLELAHLPVLDEAAVEGAQGGVHLSAQQLSRWVEDATVDLVHQWLAHPAHLARTGFDGLFSGGEVLLGFAQLEIGRREAWEPAL